jgi:carboxypeptidase Taq
MPQGASPSRGESISELSAIVHAKFLALDEDGLLSMLKQASVDGALHGKDRVIVEEVWRDYLHCKKLPEDFIRTRAALLVKSHTIWQEARQKNNFKLFLPYLTKIIELKKQEAEYIGYEVSPYDALIDRYEPGMTAAQAEVILNDLRDFLVPFLKKIKASKVKNTRKKVLGMFPLEKQVTFNRYVSEKIGFDFTRGRLDTSTHPFTTTFHSTDVRITTRYRENDIMYSLGSTVHETGHGLYEQGLLEEHYGTPLGEAVSLGIHESQSRMWETIIGTKRAFWKYFYPKLQKEFPSPFKTTPLDSFYAAINEVKPSFIRTEADEVTYNLHIIIRFEIEKGLIEGTITPKDLPRVWEEKMMRYLGVRVTSDTVGVLQDVHWSAGLFGYFPTYTFGNLYAAQFFATIEQKIPNLEKDFEKGDFSKVLLWLRKNIHSFGKIYTAKALIKKVTGKQLESFHFTAYLEKKYSDIYKL